MSNLQTADRLWILLYGTWGSPRRASKMTDRRDADRKYCDLENNYSFTPDHLAAHLAGTATYATTLGAAGAAWAGCKDYDSASEAEIVAALAHTDRRGITAAAIVMPGNRAHLWTFYDRPYPESDIRAQLRTIPRSGKGEDYPSGNPIRLPGGYHRIKQTRGTLILQDGRRFDLDTQLAAGLDALLSLPRNGKPEPGQLGDARTTGAAWGDAYKPDEWANLPDGGPLWRSPYLAAAAQRRPDLARLLRGERVTLIKRDDTRDDSDSAQVAALAYNLASADVDRQQARAIADYLHPRLRPGKTIEHYRAHFDAEWERYLPQYYKPKVIHILGSVDDGDPQPLPPAEYRPEPKSRARSDRPQKVAGPAGYLAWLKEQLDPQTDSVMLSQAQCAARLGCCVRTIKRYEHALGPQIERRAFARRQAGCLFILAPDVVPTSPADVVTADREIAQQHAENAQPATMQEEHTAPVVPSPPVVPPATLAIGVRWAIRAIEQDSLDQDTGEIRRLGRATPDRVRAWLTANYPGLDTTDVEATYPEVRKALQEECTYARNRAFWDAERAKARALEDAPLLAALVGCASRMQAAERKRPGSGWAKRCAAIFAIYDDVRRQRGLSVTDAPAPARDRASRNEAKARMGKVSEVLNQPKPRRDDAAPTQLGFVNVAEDATWLRPVEPGKGARRACVPPPPAPAGAPTPGTLPSLLAGIRAYHERQEAGYAAS